LARAPIKRDRGVCARLHRWPLKDHATRRAPILCVSIDPDPARWKDPNNSPQHLRSRCRTIVAKNATAMSARTPPPRDCGLGAARVHDPIDLSGDQFGSGAPGDLGKSALSQRARLGGRDPMMMNVCVLGRGFHRLALVGKGQEIPNSLR
jgi:hypothetical protein